MNFASLNTALLQRACNPARKPCWARANPSPFKHQTARFLKMSGSLRLKQSFRRFVFPAVFTPCWLQTSSCHFPLGVVSTL